MHRHPVQEKKFYPAYSLMLYTLFLPLLISICSCQKSKNYRLLKDADSMIESCPDSTLSLLRVIDKSTLSSKGKSTYEVLDYQAKYKLDLLTKSDSISDSTIEILAHSNNKELLARAYFYSGKRHFELMNFHKAMQNVLHTMSIGEEIDDSLLIARGAETIGDILMYANNYRRAGVYYHLASDAYHNSKKILNSAYSACDMANAISKYEDDKACSILDSVAEYARKTSDQNLRLYALNYMVPIWIQHGEIQKAEQYFESIKNLGMLTTPNDSLYLAKYYLTSGNLLRAYDILNNINPANCDETDLRVLVKYFTSYYQKAGIYEKAIEYADSFKILSDKHFDKIFTNSIYDVENDFYTTKAANDKIHEKNLIYLYSGIIILIIITAFVGIAIIVFRKYKQQKEFEFFIRDLKMDLEQKCSRLQKDNELLDSKIKAGITREREMRAEIEDLFKDKWKTASLICDRYIMNIDNNKIKSHAEIEKYKAETSKELMTIIGEHDVIKMLNVINLKMDGLIDKLKMACPKIRQQDIVTYAMLVSQFSTSFICSYLGIDKNTLYKRKSRIKSKIISSESPDTSTLIGKL